MKKKLALALVVLFLISTATATALADYGAILRRDTKAYLIFNGHAYSGTLPRYTSVAVKEVRSGVAKISSKGYTLYVKSSSLMRPWLSYVSYASSQGLSLENTFRYVLKPCYVYDYPGASGRKLGAVGQGAILTGFMQKGGWAIVMDPSETYYGYIKTSNLMGLSGGDGSYFTLD